MAQDPDALVEQYRSDIDNLKKQLSDLKAVAQQNVRLEQDANAQRDKATALAVELAAVKASLDKYRLAYAQADELASAATAKLVSQDKVAKAEAVLAAAKAKAEADRAFADTLKQ